MVYFRFFTRACSFACRIRSAGFVCRFSKKVSVPGFFGGDFLGFVPISVLLVMFQTIS
jgi:hypothetical protein